MTNHEINIIACALVHRTKENLVVTEAMVKRFGFVLTRCDLPEIKRIGGKVKLVEFWSKVLFGNAELLTLAKELLAIHLKVDSSPGIITNATKFAKALRSEAKAFMQGEEAVTREVAAERLTICRGCDHLKRTIIGSQCDICKCYVRVKTKFRTEKCPINKW